MLEGGHRAHVLADHLHDLSGRDRGIVGGSRGLHWLGGVREVRSACQVCREQTSFSFRGEPFGGGLVSGWPSGSGAT